MLLVGGAAGWYSAVRFENRFLFLCLQALLCYVWHQETKSNALRAAVNKNQNPRKMGKVTWRIPWFYDEISSLMIFLRKTRMR
jgi:hypothetical protein